MSKQSKLIEEDNNVKHGMMVGKDDRKRMYSFRPSTRVCLLTNTIIYDKRRVDFAIRIQYKKNRKIDHKIIRKGEESRILEALMNPHTRLYVLSGHFTSDILKKMIATGRRFGIVLETEPTKWEVEFVN